MGHKLQTFTILLRISEVGNGGQSNSMQKFLNVNIV